MPHPEEIVSELDYQFEKIDEMYANDDLRVFGRDTARIFKEIDVIRRKQIELASDHIGLESIDDMSLPVIQTSGDAEDDYKRNLIFFNKKEKALKSLMTKLDTLGQIMNEFRERSDLNPHTIINENLQEETTTAPTSPTHSRKLSSAAMLKKEYYAHHMSPTRDTFPESSSSPRNPRQSISVFSFDQSSPSPQK